ncbi:hypothetical protein [Microtetraspora malaysiensis]|uniref:Uncharacterized protein n=1 Tax=Microtetraspora malaysiensis TaxID=161358 RepID=A0ABW6T5N4_9ACTN
MAAARPLSSTAASAPRTAGSLPKEMPTAASAGPALRTAATLPMVVRRVGDPVASTVPAMNAATARTNPASRVREPSSATMSCQLPRSVPANMIRNVTFETLAATGCHDRAVGGA